MANYNDTYCYVFEKSIIMKEIIDNVILAVSDENLKIKNWIELDCEKISPRPENFNDLSSTEKREWHYVNWGVIQDFHYKIFENFTVIHIEGINSSSYRLFETFSTKYNLIVYIAYTPEGGYNNYYTYVNPKNNFFFNLLMSDPFYNQSESPDKFINFSLLGISEDIYGSILMSRYKEPLFSNGSIFWKQKQLEQKEEREKEELEREEKMKKIQEKRLIKSDESEW